MGKVTPQTTVGTTQVRYKLKATAIVVPIHAATLHSYELIFSWKMLFEEQLKVFPPSPVAHKSNWNELVLVSGSTLIA